MKQLVPVAEQLSPTLIAFSKLAPEAKGFFEGLEPVIDRAPTGFPAARKLFRDEFPPLLRAVDPFLRNLNPVITGLGLYKHELTATMGNLASVSNAKLTEENAAGEKIHYLRAMGPFNPESLATYPSRTTTGRTNAYPQPLGMKSLATGLPSFDIRGCTSGVTATLSPEATYKDPTFAKRTKAEAEKIVRNARRQRKILQELLRSAEEVRLRRTDRLRRDRRSRLLPAGAVQPDRRKRRGNDLPAHVRTEQISASPAAGPGPVHVLTLRLSLQRDTRTSRLEKLEA